MLRRSRRRRRSPQSSGRPGDARKGTDRGDTEQLAVQGTRSRAAFTPSMHSGTTTRSPKAQWQPHLGPASQHNRAALAKNRAAPGTDQHYRVCRSPGGLRADQIRNGLGPRWSRRSRRSDRRQPERRGSASPRPGTRLSGPRRRVRSAPLGMARVRSARTRLAPTRFTLARNAPPL